MHLLEAALLATLCLQTQASRHASHPRASGLLRRGDDAGCDRYLVSGQNPGYFRNYRFWDFRQLANQTNVWSVGQEPPSIKSGQDQGDENVTSPFFEQGSFAAGWEIDRGIRNPDSPVPMVYSAQNIYISEGLSSTEPNTSLTFRTTRLSRFQSMAEMRTTFDLLHASMRIRMKVLTDEEDEVAPGAVIGFFTYASDTQESDIEILTNNPTTRVKVTNQPASSTIPGAELNATYPNSTRWTEWVDYRLDWFDGSTVWYVGSDMVYSTSNSVPTVASPLVFNVWSNGGTFSGKMKVGTEVRVAVEWIEVAFNGSASGAGSQASDEQLVSCGVDSGSSKGTPVVLVSTASGRGKCTLPVVLGIAIVVALFEMLHL